MIRYMLNEELLPPPPPPPPVPPPQQPPTAEHDKTKKKKRRAVKFYKPYILGYMSVDVLREYHGDLSQLKYLTSIPRGRLHFDLNYNIDKAVKRTTDDSDEKISLMLKYILDQKDNLSTYIIGNETIFVGYRRTLISVMCNVYSCTPVTIVASILNNCIYFCTIESPQEILQRRACRDQDKFCAWGYKFEQYMLSDLPDGQPDFEKPVLENEEFSLYYFARLGNHMLFYGAQIDGMLATKGPVKRVPEIDDEEHNLAFLRRNRYVELKTNREIHNRVQLINFKKYKLLRCWCQCYLANLKGLLVGYRNDDGIIKRVEWFDTDRIVKICKGYWTPQVMITYLDNFLKFVKQSFNAMIASRGSNYDPTKPLTLKFDINERHRFNVTTTEDEAHVILPDWYVENIQKDDILYSINPQK